ncbi:F-box-like domain superfamily [Arabidopsis thaliana x Arabidopsis arenosa]|uniref:F-box-like domain superfamily n=1 Tax=Arabidopsis thaliana x Arabidopsis arenosa TaxID=1240361 RepID=A0A8T2AYW3_9BRAS|nr:F-box-like domain superfamily [Arabidopsis thaliana x Arabidopsis arenosa]
MGNGLMRKKKKKKNNKKKKRPKVSRNRDWSKLPPDVLLKIFESLKSPIDSHRAKTVCSNWYSVWKTCTNKPPYPWRIIHQGDSPTVEKLTRKLPLLSKTSYCMASSGNNLLMVDRRLKFYILNLLTGRRINLPSMESLIRGGQVTFKPEREWSDDSGCFFGSYRNDNVSYEFDSVEWKNSVAVLWINETTGDYVVAWTFVQHYLFSYKKGDNSWCNLNHNGKRLVLFDMACENNKLYLYTANHHIRIFDFSGVFPMEKKTENPYWKYPFNVDEEPWEYVWKRKIAIQKSSGQVLIILSLKQVFCEEEKLLFYIFKMNLEGCKWERVYSIGDEMLVFGQGVTIATALKDLGDGIKSDSIYFIDKDVWPDHQDHDHRVSNCGVFDITTSKIVWPKKIYCSINETQWFVRGVSY